MKRLISGLSLAAALAGVLAATGTPMATGALTVAPVALTSSTAVPATAKSSAVRGTVTNKTDLTIKVTNHWCDSKKGPCGENEVKELKAGKSTDGWNEDIDGYQVPTGYKCEVNYDRAVGGDTRSYSAGWHKISDDVVARIKKCTTS